MGGKHIKKSGFTIVELLIVIVVIGILAAITIVSFNGVQVKAENTKTVTAVNHFIKLMQVYKAQNGAYPTPLDASTAELYPCVGTYSGNTCASINNTDASGTGIAYASSSFTAKMQATGTVPQPSTQIVTIGGQPTRGAFASLTSSPGIIWFLKGSGLDCGIKGATKDYDLNGGMRCYFNY